MIDSLQYVIVVWEDTDHERQTADYKDWYETYSYLGTSLDPDITGAFEVGQDNQTVWWTRDELEEIMLSEERQEQAEYSYPGHWSRGQQAGRS